jgi:hypothetical protein
MDVEIRACTSAEEMRQAITPIGYYFGRTAPNVDQAERLTRVMPAQYMPPGKEVALSAAWALSHSN